MIRIRRMFDDALPVNRRAIREAIEIWRAQFPGVPERELRSLGKRLRNPMEQRFRRVFFVAENAHHNVRGFALLMHAPEEGFCFLEYVATDPKKPGRGIGGALYQRVREESAELAENGLFFECGPDEPKTPMDTETLRQNKRRLAFYEGYGAFPIINNLYDTPVAPGDEHAPILVWDGLGRATRPGRDAVRRCVRAILERKYGDLVDKQYVDKVVASFVDTTIQLRAPRYVRPERATGPTVHAAAGVLRVATAVNDQHEIHHVKERGYVQAPVRIRAILRELEKTSWFERIGVQAYPERHITAVHDPAFVAYLKHVCKQIPEDKMVYPYVFPIRNATRPPTELTVRAGYYCIDTFTPLNPKAFRAARAAVDCALAAADAIVEGRRLAYALVRPPGHHAERRAFGGFCYLNSAAIAAEYLSKQARIAMLDLDYHHGNGQQNIFYDRSDVLTISIHGHPKFAYPYFSGFADEIGAGRGKGYNINVPLPEKLDGERYGKELGAQLGRVSEHKPDVLIVLLGLDTAKGDPTGTWFLRRQDFEANGRQIAGLGIPVLVVQEGGYRTRTLGTNARAFFSGLVAGMAESRRASAGKSKSPGGKQ